jgi:signal transduction histidine kinase
VMMPGVSGHDLCRTIKSDPRLQTTPVILVTARSGSDATLEGYASGADDFIIKPFNARVLVARVRAQLKLRSLALQLLLHARLAAAGTLAAGVAHEARNPLNAILNAVAVLRRPSISQKDTLLEIIDDAARRILHVVSALEEQIRPADGMVVCDLRNGIDATLRLLDHRMDGITVHRSYETERVVTAPIGQLNQVFMNLLDNAIRARPANIWVRVCEADSRVRVLVADDGPGVAEDVAESIFDPFFTTRPAGEGSGLGLYLSRRIVSACGGTLELGRREGGGAQFSVDLPLLETGAVQRSGPAA